MHAAVRNVIAEAGEGADDDVCILDTEASSEQFTRSVAQRADTMLLVVEPYFKSMESGRRMGLLAADLGVPRIAVVANKVRDAGDEARVRDFAGQNGLEIAAFIPFDEAMPAAERAGVAPLDHSPSSPAVVAIGALAQSLADRQPRQGRDSGAVA